MKKLRIIDTSILCVWLQVPHFDHCGSDADRWDFERIQRALNDAETAGEKFVLPLAVIIETGNHIAQSDGNKRYEFAKKLAEIIKKSVNDESPWVFFGQQNSLWEPENLSDLVDEWLEHVASKSSFGDISIKQVAEFYAKASAEVYIFTGDAGLRAFQPVKPVLMPRRRA